MFSIIVAHDRNRVIGFQNKLPWHLPNDLQRLKALTLGKTIVMGRKTYASIGRALPGRKTIVITRDQFFSQENVQAVDSIDKLLELIPDSPEEVFIFGGQEVFEQMLPITEMIYLTYLDEQFVGDRFFPEINEQKWELIEQCQGIKNQDNPYHYYFMTYRRRK